MTIDVKPGYWRLTLRARVERLRLEADSLATPAANAKATALKHLQDAEALTEDGQTLAEAWFGSQVEKAWTELRLAEESLILAATDAGEIKANGYAALSHAKARLADGDNRVAALTDALTTAAAGANAAQLAGVKANSFKVAVASHEVSDQEHRAQREFRNRLRWSTLGLAALALAVAAAGIFSDVPAGWLPEVKNLKEPGHAVVAALLLGALGALFSAIPSLSQAPANTTTFNPIVEQAMLKVVVGSWSALVGLVAVAAGIQTPKDGVDMASLAGFAMMCAVFGAMQEAITRFADQKAADTKPTTT